MYRRKSAGKGKGKKKSSSNSDSDDDDDDDDGEGDTDAVFSDDIKGLMHRMFGSFGCKSSRNGERITCDSPIPHGLGKSFTASDAARAVLGNAVNSEISAAAAPPPSAATPPPARGGGGAPYSPPAGIGMPDASGGGGGGGGPPPPGGPPGGDTPSMGEVSGALPSGFEMTPEEMHQYGM